MITMDGVIGQITFQSTLSMRRATDCEFRVGGPFHISIHALHEESDHCDAHDLLNLVFQSTLSMRRATDAQVAQSPIPTISIHALHEESETSCLR